MKKGKEKLVDWLMNIFIFVGVLCLCTLVFYFSNLWHGKNQLDKLKSDNKAKMLESSNVESSNMEDSNVESESNSIDDEVRLDFLREENEDTAFWMFIKGSNIDYPIMYTPDRPSHYLRKNFQEKYSFSGLPFVDERGLISPMDNNVLIYGHNMQDGSMFAGLYNFKSKEYWESNNVIDLLTEEGHKYYNIFAVAETVIGGNFPYYNYVGNLGEKEFNDFVSRSKKKSLFDTGITPVYGDSLITLSTCAPDNDNGRLAVMAVLQK